MNTKQRFKLSAGAGLVTMLLGALMVLAPMGAGADEHNGNPNEDCPAGTVLLAKFNWQGSSYVFEKGEAGVVTIGAGADTTGGTWSSTKPVHTVIIKGSTDTDAVAVNGATSGTFSDDNLETPSGNTPGISNLQFCGPTTTEPDEPTLTVSKEIPGDGETQTFLISVTQDEVEVESDSLGDGGSLPVIDPASGQYVISETLPQSGWDPPSIDCGNATVTGTNPWTVTVAQVDVSCTITNTRTTPPIIVIPEPEVVPATLTVRKAVAGEGVPNSWTEVIDVDNVTGGTSVSNITLTSADDEDVRSSLLPGTYFLDEFGTDTPTMELTSISCSDATAAAGSSFDLVDADDLRDGINVTLAQGSDVTCVFTNTYTAQQVLPEEEEPGSITIVKAVEGPAPDAWAFGFNVSDGVGRAILTDTDADATFGQLEAGQYTIAEDDNSVTTLGSIACDDPDAVSNGRTVTVDVSEGEDVTCTFTNVFPAAEVKGDVITRTLPRTGNETRNLAGVGAFMLAMGAAMVLGSKRQLARR